MTKALLEYATKFAPMPPRTLAVLLLSAAFLLVEKDPTGPFRQLTDTYSHRRLLEEKVEVEDHEEFLLQTRHSHLPMFDSADFTVLGPSVFPKPSAFAAESPDDEIVINLKPTFGTHREDEDAVLIFAAEYSVLTYVLFFSTLRETGFKGDIVVAISKLDYKDRSVKEFLESDPHVIVYVIDFTCFNAEMEAVDSMKGGIRVCQAHKLYATKKGGSITPLPDPRNARTGQTTRYEIYWMWALQYSKHSWLMLVDVRDAVFQSNPFLKVPREPNSDREDGILLFFGVSICESIEHCLQLFSCLKQLLQNSLSRKILKQQGLA